MKNKGFHLLPEVTKFKYIPVKNRGIKKLLFLM